MDGIKGTTLAKIFLAYSDSEKTKNTKAGNATTSSQEASIAQQEAVRVNGEIGAKSVDDRAARVAELRREYLEKGDSMAGKYNSQQVAQKVSESLSA